MRGGWYQFDLEGWDYYYNYYYVSTTGERDGAWGKGWVDQGYYFMEKKTILQWSAGCLLVEFCALGGLGAVWVWFGRVCVLLLSSGKE